MDVEVNTGQDYNHAVKTIEFILGVDNNSPCSVRLPIGWVVTVLLPTSVGFTSSCFKCVVGDSSLTDQIKSIYVLESYGAFKQVDTRSAANKHALFILNTGLIVMSVYQTIITRHSPNLKHWREGYVKKVNCAKDTQTQLQRTLGKAMSLLSNRMIQVSVPTASRIFPIIPL